MAVDSVEDMKVRSFHVRGGYSDTYMVECGYPNSGVAVDSVEDMKVSSAKPSK